MQGVDDLGDPAAEERASSRGQILREFIGTEAPKEMQLAAAAGALQIFREAHSQKGWVCSFFSFFFGQRQAHAGKYLEDVQLPKASCAFSSDTRWSTMRYACFQAHNG